MGALGISGFSERTIPFDGAFLPSIKLPPANAYRPIAGANAETVRAICAAGLETALLRERAENIAAFIFEPVVGAAGGRVPAPAGYARAVREICTRHGILMIADEVMYGAGRCGTWRALEHDDGILPDIMAIAKGLAGGNLPLGAARLHHGGITGHPCRPWRISQTSHAFTGHTAACAAGVVVQRIVTHDGLVTRVATNEPRLKAWLADALSGVDAVGNIRGRGHFIAVELVASRDSKVPFPASHKLYMKIRERALENGLICYPVGGNVDGVNGDIVILAPPYNA